MISNPSFKNPKSRFAIWLLTIVLVILVGVFDSLTGPELSLAIFYLVPVFILTSTFGCWAGIIASVSCTVTYLIADHIASISYTHRAIPYWNAAFRFGFFLVVVFVVTQRKQAEDRLSRSEERFRLFAEGIKDHAIVMLDSEGKIASWNSGAARIFGYSEPEIVGKHFACFFPDYRNEESHGQHLLAIATRDGIVQEQVWANHSNGSEFWADILITPLVGKDQDLRGFTIITRDITERKKAEESIRTYAELHEIDRAILAASSAEKIAEEALWRIKTLIPFQVGCVTMFDFELEQGTILAALGKYISKSNIVIDPDARDLQILMQGETKYVQEESAEGAHAIHYDVFRGLESHICVPLLSHSKLIGCLHLGKIECKGFTEKEINVAREVANQVAIAIHNADLFEQLRQAHDRLKILSLRLLKVQETEKRHLARELHDELGQALTAVKIQLQEAEGLAEDGSFSQRVQESIAVLEKILQQVRFLSLDLRPLMLDDLGLVAALRWCISRQSTLGDFAASFHANPPDMKLPPELETNCFRVVQEALTNIVRHSKAKHVKLELCLHDNELRMLIKDDGIGFDVLEVEQRLDQGSSFGLLGMRERVTLARGKLEIESVPSCGTELRVRFPVSGVVP